MAASPLPPRNDCGTGRERRRIAAIPDTQNYTDYTHQSEEGFGMDADEMFLDQMRFIAGNLKATAATTPTPCSPPSATTSA